MSRLMMLDSGAFSVWTKSAKIDLDEYIRFCLQHPKTSYFVNLDVLPGKPGQIKSLTTEVIEESCRAGWNNYQKMLKFLPIEKVIPVFHQNDNFDWLQAYLDFGTPYIGISPANDRTTAQRIEWLEQVKPYVLDSSGKPVVKMHGFAVTSFRLMQYWHWHSVDSASWLRVSANGAIYVPHLVKGVFDYSRSPFILSVSPKSPTKKERGKHFHTLSPLIKLMMEQYLAEINMPLGSWEIVQQSSGYKLDENELWYDKQQSSVLRVLSRGAATCHQRRFWCNVVFLKKANQVLPVDHIYFAGSGQHPKVESEINCRLLSYHDIVKNRSVSDTFNFHLDLM